MSFITTSRLPRHLYHTRKPPGISMSLLLQEALLLSKAAQTSIPHQKITWHLYVPAVPGSSSAEQGCTDIYTTPENHLASLCPCCSWKLFCWARLHRHLYHTRKLPGISMSLLPLEALLLSKAAQTSIPHQKTTWHLYVPAAPGSSSAEQGCTDIYTTPENHLVSLCPCCSWKLFC